MAPKRKISIIIFVFLALVLILVVGSVVFFLGKSRHKVVTMQNALAALANGDRQTAINLFNQVLAKDPDNEAVTVKLAELHEETGNWPVSAHYWLRATRLNNLKPEYEQKAFEALLCARYFTRIVSVLGAKRSRNDEQELLFIYGLLMSGQQQKGIELWRKLLQNSPQVLESSLGRLIRVAHFSGERSFEWAFKEIEYLRQTGQPALKQEALIALASLNQLARQFETAESNLKELVKDNYYVGVPLLGEFYANHLKYPEAIDLIESYLQRFTDARLVPILGEMLVFTSQNDRLTALAERWRRKPGKNNMKVEYYLDTLIAFQRKDFEQMVKMYRPITGQIATPLSAFITVICDVQTNNSTQMASDLLQFAKYPPLFDLRSRMHFMVVLYLRDRVMAGATSEELSQLAEAILSAHLSDEEKAMAQIVAILAKLKKNTLTEGEVELALETLASNPICLEIASTFYYARHNYAEAWKYLEKLEQMDDVKLSNEIKQLLIADLGAMGKDDMAATRIHELLKEAPQMNNCLMAFRFFWEKQRLDDLRRLCDLSGEAADAVRPTIQAAILLLEKQQEKALDLLESLKTDNNDLLDFAGIMLASNGRIQAALEKLVAIRPDYQYYMQICTLLSRLYAETDQWELALQKGKEAVRLEPSSPEAKLCMARCMRHSNNWHQALDFSKSAFSENADKAVATELRQIWIWAMEISIQERFSSKLYPVTQKLCQELLDYDHNNAVAKKYSAMVADILAEEEKKAAE